MTEKNAPERIWARYNDKWTGQIRGIFISDKPESGYQEFIRADLHAAAAIRQARNDALREAAEAAANACKNRADLSGEFDLMCCAGTATNCAVDAEQAILAMIDNDG